VEAVNHALRGIPPERVRFHTCYGINEGPRIHDAPLLDIVGSILAINAGAYSFEAANARHEHEYHAGADCGFSSQATYRPEVHPTVMWAKFKAMAEGARLATQHLWGASPRDAGAP
jgi:5-methyltetrahydropteroyltriglutamate--homocysteine methyltransferase